MVIQAKPRFANGKQWRPAVTKTLTPLGHMGIALGAIFINGVAFALPPHPLPDRMARDEVSNIVSYTPPPDAGTPQPTGGTGSRGDVAITAIALIWPALGANPT